MEHRDLGSGLDRGDRGSQKDGSLITAHTTITPICDEQGVLNNIIAIQQDLSRQKNLEATLRGTTAAIEHTDDAILLVDLEGNISYANPSFFLLFKNDAATILLNPLSHLLKQCKTEHSETEPNIEGALQHGWEERLEFPATDDRTIHIRLRVSQIRDDAGDIQGFACHFYDVGEEERHIEERRLMEVRLRQSERLESIGRLAAGVAHEINTPTQFVGDNLHFLKASFEDLMQIVKAFEASLNSLSDADPTRESLRTLLQETDLEYLKREIPQSFEQAGDGIERIAEIVSAMKEFCHPGSKSRKQTDLNEALKRTVTVARNEWKYCCTVGLHLDPDLDPVLCLPGEINQAFLNIIINAAHAVGTVVEAGQREIGFIDITTLQLDEMVEIRIADNGIGIPEEIRDRIFDPFFTTKEVGKGTGQGLAVAYDVIVRKHKGDIFVESEHGVGTVFIVRLPRSLEPIP